MADADLTVIKFELTVLPGETKTVDFTGKTDLSLVVNEMHRANSDSKGKLVLKVTTTQINDNKKGTQITLTEEIAAESPGPSLIDLVFLAEQAPKFTVEGEGGVKLIGEFSPDLDQEEEEEEEEEEEAD
jgi:hypothetical protein